MVLTIASALMAEYEREPDNVCTTLILVRLLQESMTPQLYVDILQIISRAVKE